MLHFAGLEQIVFANDVLWDVQKNIMHFKMLAHNVQDVSINHQFMNNLNIFMSFCY